MKGRGVDIHGHDFRELGVFHQYAESTADFSVLRAGYLQ